MFIIQTTVVCVALFGVVSKSCAAEQSQVDQLIRELGTFPASLQGGFRPDSVEERRRRVYDQLRELDQEAIPALSRGLAKPDVKVRRGVALFLAAAGSTWYNQGRTRLDIRPCLQPLIAALQDSDGRVRELAAQAIENIGSDAAAAVPALIKLLEDSNEGSRNCACIGLHGIGPAAKDALPSLRKALSDPSPDVRRFAAWAIEKIEGGN